MEQVNYKEKYEEIIKNLKEAKKSMGGYTFSSVADKIIPELKESEDEKVRKRIIRVFRGEIGLPTKEEANKYIAWLEKQGSITKLSEEEQNSIAKGVLTSCASAFIDYLDAHKYEGKMCVSNGECEDIENAFHNAMFDRLHRYYCKYIEKQGKQEQLYIRFGDIPTDEKSKIYQGETEVGTENGVSVYPAFRTNEGNIVLGLSLPITKTTLYTQQHLIEYDNRPCYLVKGDYVGKDTDGQPLINNVSIIKKLDNYRAKEEKQGEQKPTDKTEPKFKVGDWIILNGLTLYVKEVAKGYYRTISIGGILDSYDWHIDNVARLWTIRDAKDGDVLTTHLSPEGDWIGIYKQSTDDTFNTYCFLNAIREFVVNPNRCKNHGTHGLHPATKEQRDLLFSKMKEAGYYWDYKNKELKKIEQEDDSELTDFESALFSAFSDAWQEYLSGKTVNIAKWTREHSAELLEVARKQKPTDWSEEDERICACLINAQEKELENVKRDKYGHSEIVSDLKEMYRERIDWLESIKKRMKGE